MIEDIVTSFSDDFLSILSTFGATVVNVSLRSSICIRFKEFRILSGLEKVERGEWVESGDRFCGGDNW